MSGEVKDGGSAEGEGATGGEAGKEEIADLCAKFSAFCETKTKNQFTSKACNKLVKDCFDGHYKFKNVILTNRVDSSVFSRCKEKGKPHMVVNKDNCEKFLQFTAHEFAKLKQGNDKLPKDDAVVTEMYTGLKDKVLKSTGPKIKTVKQSTTGNVQGLTDASKYTGSHKQRFDETGKGKGKSGRVEEKSKSGYVTGYKNEGVFDEDKDKK